MNKATNQKNLGVDSAPIDLKDPADSTEQVKVGARGHIDELDGLRGLAVLMVFLFHYVGLSQGTSVLHSSAAAVVHSLWCGVDLFFVLSGFLITQILLKTRWRRGYFSRFYVRRFLRIGPLYFGLLAVVFLVLPHLIPFDSPSDRRFLLNQGWLWCQAANLRMMWSGFWPFMCEKTWLHHLWSLAVEEHFYLLWPWVVSWVSTRSLRWICVGCVVVALLARIGLRAAMASPLAASVATPCRVDALAIGGLLAILIHDSGVNLDRYRRMAVLILSLDGLAVAFLFAWRRGLDGEDRVVQSVGLTLLAILAAGLILAALSFDRSSWLRRLVRLQGLRTLGQYSYGLYVYHVALQPALNTYLSTARVQANLVRSYSVAGLLRLAIAFLICLATAVVSWHLFERPILAWKERFAYDRSI